MSTHEPDRNKRGRTRFFAGLYVIILAGLAVELLLRPLAPQLVAGESVFGDLIRILLSLIELGV